MAYSSAMIQDERMPFPATGKEVEMILLSQLRESGKHRSHIISPIGGAEKWIQMNVFIKQKQPHRPRKQTTYGYQKGKLVGREKSAS